MAADLQKYLQAALTPRVSEIAISAPEAQTWFGKVWKVRGLTAAELARSREAGERGEQLKALVSAMAGSGDKAKAIRDSMGLNNDDVPADISRRIEMLTAGSVDPELGPDNREVAVKIANDFPTLFYELTNRILELTGSGSEMGKPKRSTKTAASG
jgi:hypothetical protein